MFSSRGCPIVSGENVARAQAVTSTVSSFLPVFIALAALPGILNCFHVLCPPPLPYLLRCRDHSVFVGIVYQSF